MIGFLDAVECTRSGVYQFVLGEKIYRQLSAKRRGHIFLYAVRHKLGEMWLLYQIATGAISLEHIENDHRHYIENDHQHWLKQRT